MDDDRTSQGGPVDDSTQERQCQYSRRVCTNNRAVQSDGTLHRLCLHHLRRRIRHQRRAQRRRLLRRLPPRVQVVAVVERPPAEDTLNRVAPGDVFEVLAVGDLEEMADAILENS